MSEFQDVVRVTLTENFLFTLFLAFRVGLDLLILDQYNIYIYIWLLRFELYSALLCKRWDLRETYLNLAGGFLFFFPSKCFSQTNTHTHIYVCMYMLWNAVLKQQLRGTKRQTQILQMLVLLQKPMLRYYHVYWPWTISIEGLKGILEIFKPKGISKTTSIYTIIWTWDFIYIKELEMPLKLYYHTSKIEIFFGIWQM